MVTQRSRLVANYGLKPINPVQCGSEQCEPEHDYGPASRHHWLLHFVVSGGGSFRTARGKYELGAGDIFIIRPYEVTYYCASMRDPWEYIWIGFTSEKTLPAAIPAWPVRPSTAWASTCSKRCGSWGCPSRPSPTPMWRSRTGTARSL